MKAFKEALLIQFFVVLFLSGSAQKNRIITKTTEGQDTISKYIYGHFAEHLGRCIYDAFNDFGKEKTVNIKKFKDYRKGNKDIQINLPSNSVVLLTLIKT